MVQLCLGTKATLTEKTRELNIDD